MAKKRKNQPASDQMEKQDYSPDNSSGSKGGSTGFQTDNYSFETDTDDKTGETGSKGGSSGYENDENAL